MAQAVLFAPVMRPTIQLPAIAIAAVGLFGCMPTDVGYQQPTDIDEDCETLNANIIVRSASDARSLPQKCFTVSGDVEVVGSDLADLEPLYYLRQANVLRVKDNPQLLSFAGLDRVKVLQHVEIDNNPMLGDVYGLDRTDTVARVTISKNPYLVSLTGLRSLRSVGTGGLSIRDNGALESLQDLETLERVEGSFQVENNSGLTNLQTVRRIESVGDLVVTGNTGLRALQLNVVSVQGEVRLSDNPDMTELRAFGDLQMVGGNLKIERNNALQNLNGFTATFTHVGGNLSIQSNTALTDIYELAVNLYTVGGSVIAIKNTSLSRCRADDLDLYIEEIGGGLDIGDNGAEWDPCH
jgi:hypothetical protein